MLCAGRLAYVRTLADLAAALSKPLGSFRSNKALPPGRAPGAHQLRPRPGLTVRAGTLASWAKRSLCLTVKTTSPPKDAKGFVLLPRRWIVES